MPLGWDMHKAHRNKQARVNVQPSAPKSRGEPLHQRTVPPSDRALMPVIVLHPHEYRGTQYFPGDRYFIDPLWLPKYEATGDVLMQDKLPDPHWWMAPGRILATEPGAPHNPRALAPREKSIKIVTGCAYDPGNAAFRFHTALNETTEHVSAFVRYGNSNPFTNLRQWDGIHDVQQVRALLLDADVVHCHVDYILPRNAGLGNRPTPNQVLIRHYHGSMPRGKQWPEIHANLDDMLGAVLVGARLTLTAVRPDRMYWLPITIPAARYAAMVIDKPKWSKQFRVAHSPTRRDYKGTQEFLNACKTLRARGVPIEPVLIEGLTHAQALTVKATCHATFDSFWLGIQGSGLEAAAMGQPVVAGDPNVRDLYADRLGGCPYVYANSETELVKALETLWRDKSARSAAVARLQGYIASYHTYEATSSIYEDILSEVLSRDVRTVPKPPEWRP